MSRLGLSLLVLNLVIYMSGSAESSFAGHSIPKYFIESSCRATRYPVLCVQSLLGYGSVIAQSERQLAMAALSVCISRTRSCASFVKKISKVGGIKSRDHGIIQDCIQNLGNSVDRLSQSVRELGHMDHATGEDFLWHISNVQTWVSAALTDQNTCLDGFAGPRKDGNVMAAIRSSVAHVTQLTSNALALVNRFASRH